MKYPLMASSGLELTLGNDCHHLMAKHVRLDPLAKCRMKAIVSCVDGEEKILKRRLIFVLKHRSNFVSKFGSAIR